MIDFFIKEPNIYFVGSVISLISFTIFFLKMKRILIYITGVISIMLIITGTLSIVKISKTEITANQYKEIAEWAKDKKYRSFIIHKLENEKFVTISEYNSIKDSIELYIKENP